ncbi:LysE family translocator [Aureivirga sp. CE67]|uniref:LysE family translocator n=1 Tax=Aureivirga sp. CE67 TaxID=1788983 RepID=UPI0018CBBAED|nr:LysE family transporter [Aureivirga sp. CE67]
MIKAFIFAFMVSIVVGPTAILIINYGLNGGVKKALKGCIGVWFANFTMTFAAYSINLVFEDSLTFDEDILDISSSIILIVFGCMIAYKAIKTNILSSDVKCKKRTMNPILGAYLLAVINPLSFVAYISFAKDLDVMSYQQSFQLGLASSIAALIAMTAYAVFSGHYLSKIKNPAILKFINIGSGVLIIGFGVFNYLY